MEILFYSCSTSHVLTIHPRFDPLPTHTHSNSAFLLFSCSLPSSDTPPSPLAQVPPPFFFKSAIITPILRNPGKTVCFSGHIHLTHNTHYENSFNFASILIIVPKQVWSWQQILDISPSSFRWPQLSTWSPIATSWISYWIKLHIDSTAEELSIPTFYICMWCATGLCPWLPSFHYLLTLDNIFTDHSSSFTGVSHFTSTSSAMPHLSARYQNLGFSQLSQTQRKWDRICHHLQHYLPNKIILACFVHVYW